MNMLILALILILLIIISKYLTYLSFKLGNQKYLKHLNFEGISNNPQLELPILITIFDFIIFGFFVWVITRDKIENFEEILIGFIVAIYVFIIASAISSIFVYQFVNSHEDQISGQTYFKAKLVNVIQRSNIIQFFILLSPLILVVPSSYIFGYILAFSLMLLINFKNRPIY